MVAEGDVELSALVDAMKDVQDLLPDPSTAKDEETGYAAGRWSIADATFMPLLTSLSYTSVMIYVHTC